MDSPSSFVIPITNNQKNMSYLHFPRIVFSGDFSSDVSTVNNDTQHYNNATFESSFQIPGQGATNGWWNPEGGATFGFQNCTIQQATNENGTTITDPALDGIIGQLVTGAEGRNSGKMVDLDPDQQMVSELWGVTFRILSAHNELLLEGRIKPTGFRDLQRRQTNGGQPNGQPMGASWTSVLEDVKYGKLAETSPILMALKAKTQQNKISINLNGFGYYYAHADGRFSLGKILGSIGPWFENEPDLFAPARRLYGVYQRGQVFGGSNFIFDAANARLSIDLGGAFPIADSIGTINTTNDFYLAVSKQPLTNPPAIKNVLIDSSQLEIIGKVPYQQGSTWLNSTCGIVDFNLLSADLVNDLKNNQLVLVAAGSSSTQYLLIAREAIDGIVCRADNFVQRIDTNQKVTVNLYAYQYGQPLPQTEITITMEPPTPDTPKDKNSPPISITYGNNKPQDGLSFVPSCQTNAQGMAQIEITGNSIHSPRVYIDGQIYLLDYTLANQQPDSAIPGAAPMSISIHLRDDFSIPETPTWSDISDMMTQFANLYPIMSKYFINFADPQAMIAKKDILKFAFTRDIHDPIYMPATRDLSETKRLTILKWLDNPIVDDPATAAAKGIKLKSIDANAELDTTAPTEQQQKLAEATKAKNGSLINFPALTNLFEF